MKNILLILLILLGLRNEVFADKIYYTVIAKSGLSIRKDKDINSEKMGIVKFGEEVIVLEFHRKDRIIFEEVDGFWIKIKYKDLIGYMYSGYLYPRNLFNTSYRNSDYIILDESGDEYDIIENGTNELLNFSIYEKERDWFGVIITESTTSIEKINIEINVDPKKMQYIHENIVLNFDLMTYHSPFDKDLSPINFSLSSNKIFNFIIGTKKKLNRKFNSKIYRNQDDNKIGLFVNPLKSLKIGNNDKYKIRSFGKKEKLHYDTTRTEIIYKLSLIDSYNKTEQIISNSLFFQEGLLDKHVDSKNPLLIWSGDINNDTVPDFIFKYNGEEDKCSESWMNLMISEIKDDEILFNTAFPEIKWNSIK